MNSDRHPRDLLDPWLDGRLGAPEADRVAQHVDGCARCRAEVDALRAARDAVRRAGAEDEVPDGLRLRILSALDEEDRRREAGEAATAAEVVDLAGRRPDAGRNDAVPGAAAPPRIPRRGWLLAAVVLVTAAVAVLWLRLPGTPAPGDGGGPLEGAVIAYRQVQPAAGRGDVPPTLTVDGAATLQARWDEADLAFPTRVLDLSMSGQTLVGGAATDLDGRPAALAVYRDEDGRLLECWMLSAGASVEETLGTAEEVFDHRGFRFHVFDLDGVTLVAWLEGDVLCILASDLLREDVVGLAREKAMAPPLA